MNKELPRAYPQKNTNDSDYRKYLILLLSKWYWLIITLCIAAAGAYLFNQSAPKKYRLESLIIFEEEPREYRSRADDAIENLNLLQEINRFDLESDIETLKSDRLIRQTLEKLDFEISYFKQGKIYDQELYTYTPFKVVVQPSPRLYSNPVYIEMVSRDKYKVILDQNDQKEYFLGFGEKFSKNGISFIFTKNKNSPWTPSPGDRFYFKVHSMDALTTICQEKLEVSPAEEESHIVKLTSVGEVPEKERDFLTTLIETYETYQMERINRNADISIEFIDHQMDKIDKRLLQYENELQRLWMSNTQIRNNYMYPNHVRSGENYQQATSSSSYDELSQLEQRKTQLEKNIEDFLYLSSLIENNRNIDSIPLPMNQEIEAAGISQLMQELSNTQNQIHASNQNIQPSHPLYQSLNQQYKEQQQSLLTKVNTYIDYMNKSINRVKSQIARIERDIPSYPLTERRYRETMRKIQQNENVLNVLSEKKIEFELIKASKTPSFNILKNPGLKHAALISPNIKLNYILAFFIGFVFPASFFILKRSNYSKIEEKEEIKNNTPIPILHALERNPFNTSLPVYYYPQSPIADGFRNIRTKIIYRLKAYDHKVIMVSSMVSGEGKSFVSANLVAILAMAGMNTVIVSADIRKPTLHKIFSINSEIGLSDYLSNNCNYEDLIHPTLVENLYFLPPGKNSSHAGDLFSESKINALLDYLSSRFEYIVFDSPPYSMVPESMVIGNQSHCNIFLVRHNYSPKNIIESLNDIHQEGRLKNMFLVVNSVKAMKGFGFEHYFGYDSSYGFGHYNSYYNNSKKSQKMPEHIKVK